MRQPNQTRGLLPLLAAGLLTACAFSNEPAPNFALASRADCPSMPPDVRAEIERLAQLPRPGEKPELFVGRLMISEAEKAGKLERAIRLYDQCKGE